MATRVPKTGSASVEFTDATQPLQIEDLDADLDEIYSNIDATNIVPGGVDTTVLADGAVTTVKLAAGATFTQYLVADTANVNVTTSDTVLATQVVTTTRGKVRLRGIHAAALAAATGDAETITLKLKRDGSLVTNGAFDCAVPMVGSGAKVATFNYVGDTSGGNRTITIGFQPTAILVFGSKSGSPGGVFYFDATMLGNWLPVVPNGGATQLFIDTGSPEAGASFTSTGFVTPTNADAGNADGFAYHGVAWGTGLLNEIPAFFGAVDAVDQPGAGTYTYTLTAVQSVSGAYADVFNTNRLIVEEIV
jgi:hypothetical protein